MKRKAIVFVVFISLLLFSCSQKKDNTIVQVIALKDTVEVNETFMAKLSVPHLKTTIPSFYIIGNDENFLLPYDNEKDYAIFKGESSKIGERKFAGYVEFVDLKGHQKNESFVITFYIKEKD
jgi:hypothetical protein